MHIYIDWKLNEILSLTCMNSDNKDYQLYLDKATGAITSKSQMPNFVTISLEQSA